MQECLIIKGDLSVEEYSTKFVNLIIKGDLQDAEEYA